ncbi:MULTISPECIES: HpcH/HpaI aldolase/citrate lyase family protein [Microbacterium]|uniref:CoA ester lyase n=1 Tax=Microbacterium wangchenii TaxID=2541726 RepID=A0ABX5SR77_9MICO|nr:MULTISPECIES: CoA ester lyase [Microbacterium]MCK6065180.1 CoA ester lyase [Microbacterium sp. EYE_512]QBR88634.1 CoA ester lyase [Microbacterium wangchenii]TFV82311.1 CoA ester lyase [Microbacterium sp. dk485]TXK20359.1 CoA ester lyase [Microbacterium wangchenii]
MTEFALGPALLFCPADRPERFAKAAERADAVILDLEDAVGAEDKTAARGHVIEAELDPGRTIVRVSAPGTAAFVADMASLSQTDFRTIMVAKAESAKSVRAIDARFSVIALCETARGVAVADKLAASDRVVALMWGAEDLVASLGGTSSRDARGQYRDIARHARSRVLLAARARGKAAIDAVHLDIADTDGLRAEAEDAAASGFTATACIHPSQAEVIRAAYRPDPAMAEWAAGVLRAAEGQGGVFRYEGRMIDEPVLVHARRILARSA